MDEVGKEGLARRESVEFDTRQVDTSSRFLPFSSLDMPDDRGR